MFQRLVIFGIVTFGTVLPWGREMGEERMTWRGLMSDLARETTASACFDRNAFWTASNALPLHFPDDVTKWAAGETFSLQLFFSILYSFTFYMYKQVWHHEWGETAWKRVPFIPILRSLSCLVWLLVPPPCSLLMQSFQSFSSPSPVYL